MIPGFQKAIDVLQAELNLIKAEMYQIQDLLSQRNTPTAAMVIAESRRLESPVVIAGKKRGRPKKAQGYWASMSAGERSAEMVRRRAKGQGRRPKERLHPRDEGHPDHEQWLANVKRASNKAWNNLSPRERKRRIKAMNEARDKTRSKTRRPTVILEKTA